MQSEDSDVEGLPLPAHLVGTFRRIGLIGPIYEIVGQQTVGDNSLAPIRVLESGEEADYPIKDILNDPEAD